MFLRVYWYIINELIDVVCKFLLRFFIVYAYDVTDVTQRALLEYLATNVPVCESN